MGKAKEANDPRNRVELCDWNETLHATALDKGDHYSAKAKRRGMLTEGEIAPRAGLDAGDVERLLVAVGQAVHEGYDVHLCEAVRFYACVRRLETPYIAAATMGNFRRSVADKAIRPVLRGRNVSLERVKELNRQARREHPHVTPDTMATCPKCGTEFRIGKMLG